MYFRIALVVRPDDLPGNAVWQTYTDLVAAGHAVELIDPDRLPEALLPDGTAHEAYLKPFVDTFRPDLITTDASSAQAVLAACARSGARGMANPAKRFVLLGYIGEGNFGDELIFSLIARHVRATYPEGYVSLIGHNPSDSLQRHGVNSVDVTDRRAIDLMLNGAAALMFMAGVLFDIYFPTTAGRTDFMLEPEWEIPGQVACVQLAWMHGVPTVYLGIGAGPLSNPDAQAYLRLAAKLDATFCPRDPETHDLLAQAGVPESQLVDTADIAFTLAEQADCRIAGAPSESERTPSARTDAVVVTLRDFATVDDAFPERVAQALDAIVKEFDVTVEFLDLAPEDADMHARVIESMEHGDHAVHAHAELDLDLAVERLASAKAALAMRLHGSIVSNAFGIPSVGFDYNEKVGSHYRLCGQESLLLGLDASAERIESALRDCLVRGDVLSHELERTIAGRLKSEALRNFEVLDRAVRDHPNVARPLRLYDRFESPSSERARELSRALETERQERERLERELEEVRASTAWKVGRALTAPLRKAADRVRANRDS